MKKLAYTVGGKQLVITLDEKRGSIRAIEANGKPLEPTAEEMPIIAGVISLALLTYETEVVHDEETDVITLQRHCTPWNSPARQMNNARK